MNLDRIHRMNDEAQARHDENELEQSVREREIWGRGFEAGWQRAMESLAAAPRNDATNERTDE